MSHLLADNLRADKARSAIARRIAAGWVLSVAKSVNLWSRRWFPCRKSYPRL